MSLFLFPATIRTLRFTLYVLRAHPPFTHIISYHAQFINAVRKIINIPAVAAPRYINTGLISIKMGGETGSDGCFRV